MKTPFTPLIGHSPRSSGTSQRDDWEYPSAALEGEEAPKWKRMQENSLWESICTDAGR